MAVVVAAALGVPADVVVAVVVLGLCSVVIEGRGVVAEVVVVPVAIRLVVVAAEAGEAMEVFEV